MSDLERILTDLYEVAYNVGYRSGQRMWTDVSKGEVIRAAGEKINALRHSRSDDEAWTSWIDHASVRESKESD